MALILTSLLNLPGFPGKKSKNCSILSLSYIDLDFIPGEVEISCKDDMNIDEDENFILDVIGNVFTLIANFANVFKNILTVFQNLNAVLNSRLMR